MAEPEKMPVDRRSFLKNGLRGAAALAAAAAAGATIPRMTSGATVWQIDPFKCTQCGRCETECVLSPSAVKCVHAFDVCGYCDLCGGYHQPNAPEHDTAAENQLCPAAAIKRRHVEGQYFQYTIDESLCTACGKCVKGCASFGNGSLYLQVRHDRCVNCNQCSIARACPSGAYRRVPADRPYLLKKGLRTKKD